jgi:hypothetical protein
LPRRGRPSRNRAPEGRGRLTAYGLVETLNRDT